MFWKRGQIKRLTERPGSRSITGRLIFLYSLSTVVLLAGAMGILYYTLAGHIDNEDKTRLSDKFSETRAALIQNFPPNPSLQGGMAKRIETGSSLYFVRILDDNSQMLAETSGMERILPKSIFPALRAGSGGDIVSRNHYVGDRWFLLASGWAAADSSATHRFLVQIAQDRSDDKRLLEGFLRNLGGVLFSGTAAAILIGWLVTRRGLKPMEEMIAAVHRVEASQLHERMGANHWPQELAALAGAFDAMLSRLEDAFDRG